MRAPEMSSVRNTLHATLRISIAIGALLALAWPPTHSSAVEPSTDDDAVIVGAGTANTTPGTYTVSVGDVSHRETCG
jgi:hypothetical protein